MPEFDAIGQHLDEVRMIVGDVVQFHRVVWDVKQFGAIAVGIDEEFPAPVSDGEDGAAVDDVAGDAEAPFPHQCGFAIARCALEDVEHVFALQTEIGGDGAFGGCAEGGC